MFKRGIFIVILCLFSISLAMASFTVPAYVYTSDRIKDAGAEAASSNIPLLFIYSDKNTDCPLCAGATRDVFNYFYGKAVIVYFDKNGWNDVPVLVTTAINSPAAGQYIPISVIVDSSISTVISIVPYQREGRTRLFHKTENIISEFFAQKR